MSDIATPGSEQPTGNDLGRLLVVINTALIGVPGAYAASGSLMVTALAAMFAVALVICLGQALHTRPCSCT